MIADGAHSAAELASLLGATLVGDADVKLTGVAGLDDATPTDLTFIRDARYAARWGESCAGAAVVTAGLEAEIPPRAQSVLLIVDDADRAMMQLLEALKPETSSPEVGIHASAAVDPTATIAEGSSIGAHVTIGARSTIGQNVILREGVSIGADVSLGDEVLCYPNVVIYDRCTLANRVILHSGVVIGADGFGYRPNPDGDGVQKIPHIGAVRIDDDVEIGANSCVDRGKFSDTVIGRGTKIDNHVQIAHGCTIGRWCLICGQAAMAGSVKLGDGVMLGGGVGIADNISIGDGARVGAKSGVMSDIPAGESHIGYPAMEGKTFLTLLARLRRLPKTLSRYEALLQSTQKPS
jgi:UDP-3-O-[3-hydroxymyristoyl] glucosamine N-acyltransferase